MTIVTVTMTSELGSIDRRQDGVPIRWLLLAGCRLMELEELE